MTTDNTREQFEAWALSQGYSVVISEYAGFYVDVKTRYAWQGWQARGEAWQPIETAPPEKEILGFCNYEPANIEGVTQPNKFPFVCMLVPADGEYDTHWVVYDAYGDILQDDGHPPTHWMPLPQPPKEIKP